MTVDSVVPPGGDNRIPHEPLLAQALGASLTVNDLRRSLTWYRDVVGFTVDRRARVRAGGRVGSARVPVAGSGWVQADNFVRAMSSGASMRVAALYDVHGNLPALDAALGAAETAAVDLFVLGGDLALGPMPCEVLDRLIDLGTRARYVRGNCDRLMVDAFDGRSLASVPPSVQESIAWAAGQLHRRHRDFLAGLPETLTVAVDGLGTVLFCHATPRSDDDIVTVRTSDERLRPIFSDVAQAVVVCGHTHMQYHRRLGALHIVNAGSVGMPFGANGAHWLLLGPHIQHMRTPYDGSRAVERLGATSYPQAAEFAARYVLHPPSEEEMLAVFDRTASTRQ